MQHNQQEQQAPQQEQHEHYLTNPSPRWPFFLTLTSLAVILSYADRTNMGIAIVPMSEEFGWSSSTKGTVLGAFFFGYIGTQIAGGWIADRWGGEWVLAGGVLMWSLATLLTPLAAIKLKLGGAVAVRIALGLAEGVGYPAIHAMLPKQVPGRWLNAMVAVVNSMSYVGGVIALLMSGPLAARYGWPYIFYVFGGAGMVWCVPWVIWIVLFSPETNPTGSVPTSPTLKSPSPIVPVSPTTSKRRVQKTSIDKKSEVARAKAGKPWKKLLASAPVWALFTASYCNCWGFWMMLSWLPTYFREHYGSSLEDLGYLSVLPYALQGIVGLVAGFTGDAVMSKGLVSKRVLRLTAQSIGMLGPAVLLLGLLGTSKSLPIAATLLTSAMALNALSTIGVGMNHFDLAPRHAGLLFGLSNTVAVLPGIIGVQLTGWILESEHKNRWGVVFGLAAVHYVVGLLVWAIFGSCNQIVD